MPGLFEELFDLDYVMAYGGELLCGILTNGFYFGPTKECQATVFFKKVAILVDNVANASLKDIDAILALNIHLPIT